jgi:hypothetical protein
MDYLTDEQRAAFEANNALVGLGPAEFTAPPPQQRGSLAPPSRRLMSHDPEESNFTPHLVEVGSIADLRRIAGFPEEHVGAAAEPHYPDPPSEQELQLVSGNNLTSQKFQTDDEDLQQRIMQAANAYVMGDPSKVKEYEPLINAAMFPGQVAAFAGDTLEIPANTVHVIGGDNPVYLNYGQIIVGEGATISIETYATINTQIFVQE